MSRATRIVLAVLALGLGTVATVGWTAVAHAQVGEQTGSTSTALTGKITALDAKAHSITVVGANGEGGKMAVDPKATIKDNSKKQIALGDLKVGWRVEASVDTRPSGPVVTYIEVVEVP
jgi:hypothetical protein